VLSRGGQAALKCRSSRRREQQTEFASKAGSGGCQVQSPIPTPLIDGAGNQLVEDSMKFHCLTEVVKNHQGLSLQRLRRTGIALLSRQAAQVDEAPRDPELNVLISQHLESLLIQ
jgi:hypothetical protein